MLRLVSGVPSWDDVRRIALSLPESSERLSRGPDVYFTTPHFDGYAAVLVVLEDARTLRLRPWPTTRTWPIAFGS